MTPRFPEPIYVTRPVMPPLDEFTPLLAEIWESRWLTNNGPFHEELEARLREYLGVEYLSLFCNGTVALMVALQMLGLKSGEVITTPFTFAATPHVLHWNGLRPVFADIDPRTYNLAPERIEAAMTPETRAIMPVHVYGTPCDIAAIQAIADKHGLPVIFDAAHTFGARIDGASLCAFGDAAILSFHATKLFSTAEGGALIVKTKALQERVNFLKNFGIAGEESVIGPGINGKMNELQAAFGLLQLRYVADEIAQRSDIDACYRSMLSDIPGITLLPRPANEHNYAYFPILIDEQAFGMSRDQVFDALRAQNVIARKYFYPLCSHYDCYAALPSAAPKNLPVAERVAKQVLCLPIYGALAPEDAQTIAELVRTLI